MTEVGFLAAARGDRARARQIFGALERVRPQGAFVYVGLAMAQLNAGQASEAVRELERGLAQVPDADQPTLQALRALALQLAGRTAESVRASEGAGASPLARAMLGRMQAAEEI